MPKRLLLPSAKSGVLIDLPQRSAPSRWRTVAVAFGLVAVLVGGADLMGRVATAWLGNDALFAAFAPATLLLEPDLEAQVQATSTTDTFTPMRLIVPAIGVDARVEEVGKTTDGAMATPKALANIGWYKLGSKPGGTGSVVFAGHVNNALGLPGVFKELSKVKKGDTVVVAGPEGQKLAYQVVSSTSYRENNAPLEEIFTTTGPQQVVLITCAGEWDEATHTFDRRLVVVAKAL